MIGVWFGEDHRTNTINTHPIYILKRDWIAPIKNNQHLKMFKRHVTGLKVSYGGWNF